MLNKKITRREFLKTSFLGIFTLFALPILKLFGYKQNTSYKNAKYYKNLAG